MTNLLPLGAQKEVKREYRIRLASVIGVLVGVVCIGVALLLFPTYMLLTLQKEALLLEEQKEEDNSVVYDEHVRAITKGNTYITQLIGEQKQHIPTDVVAQVIAADDATITLTTIDYTTHEEGGRLSLVGVADERDDLVAFVDRLKADPLFRSAVVPIEDLAPERDLPFRLTVELVSIHDLP